MGEPGWPALAASLGGLLLARTALGRLAAALIDISAATTAAAEVAPLLRGGEAAAVQSAAPPAVALQPDVTLQPDVAVQSTMAVQPDLSLQPDFTVRSASHVETVQLAGPVETLQPACPVATAQPAGPAEPAPNRPSAPPLLIEARRLSHRQPGASGRPVLTAASFRIRTGDRVLLTGPSGAGKSTLAAILAGHRLPDAGLLLLGGLDRPTLGAGPWRRRVVAVPQLHDNHLFAETLAWNLLLGCPSPPGPAGRAAAEQTCRDLGLGPLLDRLPAGLDQRIGEAGWTLSDGEASRVCLARALLQQPDLLILDESLAALDPDTRLAVLAAVEKRARTLIVIAHPDDRPHRPAPDCSWI